MKKYILSAIAIATALFAGCNRAEFEAPALDSNVVKVTAALEDTKVAGNADNSKYLWSAGDVIGVWTGAEFTPFTIDASSVGTGVGVFTGTLPEGGAITEASIAVYPYSAEDVLDGTTLTTNYNNNNWDYKSAVPMYAKATATANGSSVANFKFSLLTAAAKLTIKNIPAEAKCIFLEAPQKILFGSGTAELSDEFPKATQNLGNYDFAFINLPEHDGVIKEFTFYIPIVCGEYADPKLRFTLFSCSTGDDFTWAQAADNGGIGEMAKSVYNHNGFLNTGGYINRGDLFVLPEVNFGAAEPEEVSIAIDGDFADWDNSAIASVELQEGAALKALKTVKYAADASYLYVYMHLADIRANNNAGDDNVMMDFYIDCDGDPATGGVRSDVYNHGINWYFETFLGDPNQGGFGKWDNGQYDFIGADGASIWGNLNQYFNTEVVVREGVYDEANDAMTVEARLDRTFFKLVNTKAAFGMVVMEGSSGGWPAMGKLPQNDDLSMFVVDLPAYAAPAEPAEIALTADMISTNAPMEYLNACGGGDEWVMYEPWGLTDAADWVKALSEEDAAAREAQLGLAANMWDGDASTAFMTNFDIWELGGGWATRSGSAKTGHYVQITFNEAVNGVKMFLKNGPYYPFGDAGFNIAVSADGSSFANTAASPYVNVGVGTEITIDEIKGDAPLKAIRILNNAAADWTNNGPVICISELKLWGLQ